MPDLVSVAIGGGTMVQGADGGVVLGPGSVGYRLPEEALVFGGKVATLTDAIVAAGRAKGIGDAALVAGYEDLLCRAIVACDLRIEEAVDGLKSSGRELPLVAVGGGSGLIPDTLAGVAEVLRPENCEVANAIGAAIATVSGEVDRVFAFREGAAVRRPSPRQLSSRGTRPCALGPIPLMWRWWRSMRCHWPI